VFNAISYLRFLKRLKRRYASIGAILIQDNASYHKHGDVWAWYSANRDWLQVLNLPPYSPELNPVERIWQHTRRNGTHNRYFVTIEELRDTLKRVFTRIQRHCCDIDGYLLPFCA
jgi:putative transposase